ncbi:MAG: DUF6089 family protein [Bacteroidales bacterium]|jgi:hypothetical protein|nr:DUF6089 family protein [Bacteroidales bacterium]MDD4703075.1 DUF6089 family protein [Bacteroidales bacterium]MDX9797855.1 DUF6089 family protein [Bacteroidales bacterium]MDY4789018.1 DUF6089 family protein [Bacteroidales bacterium]
MKRIILIIILSLIALQSKAQFIERSEFGITVGGGNYFGDLNPKYNFYKTNLMVGAIYRYNFNPRWVVKASAMFGKVGAYDSDFDNIRNLSFESRVNELALTCEFNFFDYQTGSKQHRITPYIFGGIGVFFFNPKAELTDPLSLEKQWVELQPLSTEGQGLPGYDSPYSLVNIAVPFGLGLKVSLSQRVCIGLEWGIRMTFTDYLDDVSKDYVDRAELTTWSGELAAVASDRTNEVVPNTYNQVGSMRGNPKVNDLYQFFGLTITTKLNYFKSKCNNF